MYPNHPGMCLAFKVRSDGKALVYATDHEPYRAKDLVAHQRSALHCSAAAEGLVVELSHGGFPSMPRGVQSGP